MFEIITSSPQALSKVKSYDDKYGVQQNTHHRNKYPFSELQIGQSFTVPLAEANENSLRITSANTGKKLFKKFSVIKHNDYRLIEVARIA